MMPRLDLAKELEGIEDPFLRELVTISVRHFNTIWYDL